MHAIKLPAKPVLTLLAALGAGALTFAPNVALAQNAAKAAALSEDGTYDKVVFRNGRVVEGQILDETDTTVQMRIVVAGISTVTTYLKTDILSIEKDLKVEGASETPAPSPGTPTRPGKPAEVKREVREDAPSVYHFTLEGEFGRDITQTSLSEAFSQAMSAGADVIVIEMDCESRGGFDGLFVARIEQMSPQIEHAMAQGQRVVFWIDRALGGAAFLPFVSPEIYFKPEGRLGGIGTLQNFDIGNKRVNEKQISLRLGHAEGLAITGGYAPELIRAMARQQYWLAYRTRGGEIEFLQREPTQQEISEGWIVLTDDGEGKNKDKMEDVVRGRGNDVLNLDATTAVQLQVSDGTAATLDDLMFLLGYGREFRKHGEDTDKYLKTWAERVDRAEESVQRILKDLQSGPSGSGDAKRQIGERMRLLQQLRSILGQYEEIFDPDGSQRSQIDIELAQLRLALQRAR